MMTRRTSPLRARLMLAATLAMTLSACPCSKKPPEAPKVPGVHALCIEASPQLNFYREAPHTLFLRLFQLANLDAFNQLEPQQLLESRTPVAGAKGTVVERTIYPGTATTVRVRIEKGAKFLGAVAGYYQAQGDAKAHRRLVANVEDDDEEDDDDEDDEDEDDDDEGNGKSKSKSKSKKNKGAKDKRAAGPCLQLGPNGIEGF